MNERFSLFVRLCMYITHVSFGSIRVSINNEYDSYICWVYLRRICLETDNYFKVLKKTQKNEIYNNAIAVKIVQFYMSETMFAL